MSKAIRSQRLTRGDIAKIVAKETGFSLLVVNKISDAFFVSMAVELLKTNHVHINGFGNFVIKKRKERNNVHDFKTGGTKSFPAHYSVKFDLSKTLMEMMHSVEVVDD